MQNFIKIFYFHSDKRNKRLLRRCLVIFFCLFSNSAFAQSAIAAKNGFALLKGKVLDQQTQKPIPKASVSAVSGKIKQSTFTNSKGVYSLQLKVNSPKQPSGYKVSSSKTGYITQTKQIWVRSGKTYTLDFKLIPANQPPQITSITPPNNSEFLSGASVLITVIASDPEGDALQYQFSIAGQIKQPWSSNNTYTWQTSEADTGLNEIICEVKDSKGAAASQNLSYSIINPTVEETLQKVADNYALVNDKTMDVTITSQFNSESFGQTIYTRHYFKNPDKQRTETFSNPDRTDNSMTEIQIVVGPTVYLIEPISKSKSKRDISNELNLTQEELNQMDEIYHLQDFLIAHNLSRKNNIQDLTDGLVTIEAIPKTSNGVYSKLELQIDYFKGLRTKSQTYLTENSQDKLKQSIEIVNSEKMSNGAWVSKKEAKTLYLTDGNLKMSFDFTNIQINTGLADYLFDPERQ